MRKTYYVVRKDNCCECGQIHEIEIEKIDMTSDELAEMIDDFEDDWEDRIHENLDDAKSRVLDIFDHRMRKLRDTMSRFFENTDKMIEKDGSSYIFL